MTVNDIFSDSFTLDSKFDVDININPIRGSNFILSHLEGLWPKTVSTHWTANAQVRANCIEDAIYRFCQSRLLDCKISAYPEYTDEFRKGAHDCNVIGGRGITPSLLFIDLDKGAFNGDLTLLKTALFKTLHNINEKFHGRFRPTILWSGNGYHIYLPVQLSGPSWCLAYTDIFHDLCPKGDADRRFIQWAEQYLSEGKADPAHSKGVSFKNMMLRIPGSINSKNGQRVIVLQKWDGQRPCINWILRDFRNYLIDKKLKPQKKKQAYNIRLLSTRWGNK